MHGIIFTDLKTQRVADLRSMGGAARTAGIDMHAGQKTETLLTITTTSNRLLACQFLPTIGFGFPCCYLARR